MRGAIAVRSYTQDRSPLGQSGDDGHCEPDGYLSALPIDG